MTYSTKEWAVNGRITESAPNAADTADFTLKYWVVAGTTTTERTAAENCFNAQCVNMGGTGRTTVILSSAATGVTR